MRWTKISGICSLAALLLAAGALGLLRAQQPNRVQGRQAPGESKPVESGGQLPVYQSVVAPAPTTAPPAAPGAYWQIAVPPPGGAESDDPETAALRRADATMAQQSQQLVARYAATEDAQQRNEIKTQLAELLGRHFETQQQLRERELSQVEARVKKLRELAQKRREAEKTIVAQRLEQLLREADGLGWTPPSASLTAEPKAAVRIAPQEIRNLGGFSTGGAGAGIPAPRTE